MKKMKTLSIQVGDIICFEVPKTGGATIRGNTVLQMLQNIGLQFFASGLSKSGTFHEKHLKSNKNIGYIYLVVFCSGGEFLSVMLNSLQ